MTITKQRSGQKKGAQVKLVPIDLVLAIEADTILLSLQEQRRTRDTYERYVSGIMNSVSVWLGHGEAEKADKEKLAKAVKRKDEMKLFSFVSDVIHINLGISYASARIVSTSIKDNKFNCYSSSVLIADALTRIGKEMRTITLPEHVLLAGKTYAFETTAVNSAVRPKTSSEYAEGREKGVEVFTEMASVWYHDEFFRDIRYRKSADANMRALRILEECDKKLEINNGDTDTLLTKGKVLMMLGRHIGALETLDKALGIDLRNEELWSCKGATLTMLHRYDEAIKAYDKELEINPRSIAAWIDKAGVFHILYKFTEADMCLEKVKELKTETRAMPKLRS